MKAEDLLLKNYDYDLPKELIAYEPSKDKEEARLLVYDRTKESIIHSSFKHLDELLPPCAIVFNDTKVIKARLFGTKKSGAKIELFFHEAVNEFECKVQIKGRVKIGDELFFEKGLSAKVQVLFDDGLRLVCFFQDKKLVPYEALLEIFENIGHIPLPPYIKRAANLQDSKDYQSVFAKNLGAIAAPTASLHFSKASLEKLALKHKIYYLSLHVGAGTFKSVECENILDHSMHAESFVLDESLARLLQSKEKILGVGTTTTRCIENFVRFGKLQGKCELFLHPQNKPLRQDYLLTNFHLPKSTLIMLVASFIGRKKTLELYEEAIKHKYRFYSYGDAMLIL